MAKFVFDIESTGLANCTSIDYNKKGYPLKDTFKIHCIVAQDIDTENIFAFYDGDKLEVVDEKTGRILPYRHFQLEDFKRVLKSADSLIGHNIINYDLFVLKKYWGIDYTIGEEEGIKDTVGGKECFIDDTLVKSKLLNPDRRGGHSLANFGEKLGFAKGSYGKQPNAWDKFSVEMLAYCIDDVRLNTKVHDYLNREWGTWDWDDAYRLEKATKELVTRGEQRGFYFDKELAEWCERDLNEKLKNIEDKVHPLLPRKMLPKSKQPTFPANPFAKDGSIGHHGWNFLEKVLDYPVNREALNIVAPPKTAFKKDGSLSTSGRNYCIKHEIEDENLMPDFIRSQLDLVDTLKPLPDDLMQQAIKDLREGKMPDLTVPMQLSDQKELKEYLVEMGWEPQVWSEDDLRLDKKTKQSVSREKYEARVERYVKETLESAFCKFRCDFLQCSPKTLRQVLLSKDISKPVKRWGSPKYTINDDKDIDPNLLKLGEKVSWVKDVVMWLTYRHRRNAIHSPPNASKKEWSGWLSNQRINVDSRIPTPADTCGAATGRFTHIDVANIPRVSSVYGEYMRALFGVDKETHYQIGMDFDSLEAKIEAHFCYPFKGGKEYGVSLTAAKPNDIHSVNAKKMNVERDTAKTFKYACLPTENSEVLTVKGWKKYDALNIGDKVLTYNTTKDLIEEDFILDTHFFKDQTVIKMKNKLWSLESTGDHRWYGWQRRSRGHTRTGNLERYKEYGFRTTDEINSEFNILCSSKYPSKGSSDVTPDEASFVGWLLSDGYYKWSPNTKKTSSSFGTKRGINGMIGQANHKFYKEVESCLESVGAEFSLHVDNKGIKTSPVNRYHFKSEWLRNFLDRVVGSRQDKCDVDWVSWILKLSSEARESFLYSFWLADGDTKGKKFNKNMKITQNKGNIADSVLLSMFFLGKRVTDVEKHEDCRTLSQLSRSHMTSQEFKKEVIGKKDVFCITTENGTFITRQNNLITITGNCSYGAQPPKLAKQMNWELSKAQKVFNNFWDASSPLRDCIEDLKKEWSRNGKKFIKGLDGRKLFVRSPHSIANMAFQSSGVTCAKRAAVWWDRQVAKEKLIGISMLCMYHDEQQTEDLKENVKFKIFENKESAEEWKNRIEISSGKLMSDVGHKGDNWFVAYCRSGELAALSCAYASKYYKLNVELSGGYMIGQNWADCH